MKNLIGMLGVAAIAVGVSACGGGVKTAMDTRESARDKDRRSPHPSHSTKAWQGTPGSAFRVAAC